MKTDDLIKVLVADNGSVEPPISRTVLLALAAGCGLAAATFMGALHVRPDFAFAILNDPRFAFKFVFTASLAIAALILLRRLVRPDGKVRPVMALLLAPVALLGAAVSLEVMSTPRELWAAHAMGMMPLSCMKFIPILSLGPLAALFVALRHGATSSRMATGAVAGLLAGAIGATLYASFCTDDSPLFLAIWYVIGIGVVTVCGAVLGPRLLKW